MANKTDEQPKEPFIPSSLTRDELLVFNTLFFVFLETKKHSELPGLIAAFERYADTRHSLMEVFLEDAEAGIQRCITVPPEEEMH